MKTARAAFFLSASLLALACKDELCIGSPPPRCEGNVRSYCPGGFGTLDMTRDREDCGAELLPVGPRCDLSAAERDAD